MQSINYTQSLRFAGSRASRRETIKSGDLSRVSQSDKFAVEVTHANGDVIELFRQFGRSPDDQFIISRKMRRMLIIETACSVLATINTPFDVCSIAVSVDLSNNLR